MPGWPGGLGNRLQGGRAVVDQGLGDRLQAIQEYRAALERGRIAQAFGAASEGQREPSEALYAAKHRRAQGLPPETSFLEDVASLGPRAVGGAQKMAAAVPMAAEALWNDPMGSINRAGLAGQAATDAIVQGAAKPFTQFGDPNVDPVKQGADLGLTVMGMSSVVPVEANAVRTFGGITARNANTDMLALAKKMTHEGVPRERIWQETGWYKAPDKEWKFEIDDSGSSVPDRTIDALTQNVVRGGKAATAETILQHPDLYAAYPELRHMDVDAGYDVAYPDSRGFFQPGIGGKSPQIGIRTNALAGPEGPRSLMLHELQHPIQRIENFAKGGSPAMFEGSGVDPMDAYRSLAGEVEARNVQRRRNFTPEERRQIPPWQTQDISAEQQRFNYAVNGPQASIKAYHGSPHDFERFDSSKIGTGEGAQAYGHGLYFGENEAVARGYRDTLAPGVNYKGTGLNIPEGPEGSAVVAISNKIINAVDPQEAHAATIKEYVDAAASARKIAEGQKGDVRFANLDRAKAYEAIADAAKRIDPNDFSNNPGHMYEVNIAAQPHEFIDYDKPLSEQPETVRKAVEARGVKASNPTDNKYWHNALMNTFMSTPEGGSGSHADLGKAAAAFLQKNGGAKGFKYLDQGSRVPNNNFTLISPKQGQIDEWTVINRQTGKHELFKDEAAARDYYDKQTSPTRNYVVFDDKLISILRKYGLPISAAGLAALSQLHPQEAQAQPLGDRLQRGSQH